MDMVRDGFILHPGIALFRALKGFLVQFGLHGMDDIYPNYTPEFYYKTESFGLSVHDQILTYNTCLLLPSLPLPL